MCGRFSLGLPYEEVQELHGYNVQIGEWVNQDQFVPRHNIAPRSNAPVVRRRHPGPGSNDNEASDELMMQTMKWGLVPHWSKHEDTGLSTMNARCENLVEGGGMWGSLRGKKRCAVPCEGYFEWMKKGKERLPYFVKNKNANLILLAGLYDCVTLEGHTEPLWTFTVVTTDANSEFSWLHDRQPVILSNHDDLVKWLDTTPQSWTPELTKLVKPYHDKEHPLECYQVPKEVGKVGTESPTFIQPIAQRKDGIQAMFAKQKQATSSSAKASPSKDIKRKRSTSPASNQINEQKLNEPEGPKPKVQKMNTWEDDSDIEYVEKPRDTSSTSPQVNAVPSRVQEIHASQKRKPSRSEETNASKRPKASSSKPPRKSTKSSSPSLKDAAQKNTHSPGKITTFFSKT